MRDVEQVYDTMVVRLVFPKDKPMTFKVHGESALQVAGRFAWAFQPPCNPYAEVIRGLISLETSLRPPSVSRRDEQAYRFLQIDFIKRRVKYGIGSTYLDFKCWSFQGILNEIRRS